MLSARLPAEPATLYRSRRDEGYLIVQIVKQARPPSGLRRLREAVDEHVLALFEVMFGQMTADGALDFSDPGSATSLAEMVAVHLPADSAVPGYLRHLLLADTDAGRLLFGRLYEVSQAALAALSRAGLASPGGDPAVRVAFLLANDLAVLLLRDRIAEVIGVDPLSTEGMGRWAKEVLAVYGAGIAAPSAGRVDGDHHTEEGP